MNKQVIRLVDRTSHHHIGATVVQTITGQLDRVKRRGTGSIEGKSTRAKAQRMGSQMGGQAGVETVFGVRTRLLIQPHALRVARL